MGCFLYKLNARISTASIIILSTTAPVCISSPHEIFQYFRGKMEHNTKQCLFSAATGEEKKTGPDIQSSVLTFLCGLLCLPRTV